MRQNEAVAVSGGELLLVPYQRHHVPKYHNWMQSPALLEATASEPLSIEKEYDMQSKWHIDNDKCTFIVLETARVPASSLDTFLVVKTDAKSDIGASSPAAAAATATTVGGTRINTVTGGAETETSAMIGDVNLFFNISDEPQTAEIEVMIAETGSRGKGLGRQAVLLMIWYAIRHLGVTKFIAKIGFDNAASLHLFKQSLQFVEISRCEHFREVTLEFSIAAGAASDSFVETLATAAQLKPPCLLDYTRVVENKVS